MYNIDVIKKTAPDADLSGTGTRHPETVKTRKGIKMEFQATKSRTGIHCLWEEGGGMSNTGRALVIAGPNGEPKAPLVIPTRGHLACGQHALVPVEDGDIVITVDRNREGSEVKVYRVITVDGSTVMGDLAASRTRDHEWNKEVPFAAWPSDAIIAAIEKATCYHCRHAHYVAAKGKA